MREIITDESKLTEYSDVVNVLKDNKEIRAIVSELKSIMRKNNLTSLSAPAIGINKRIFCIDFKDSEIKTFINPIITQRSGLTMSRETCTSLPGRTFIYPRNNDINVMYENINSKPQSRQMVGLAAIVFQHEMDHLDSVLLSDIALEIDPEEFDNAPEEEQFELISAYLDSLDMKLEEVNKKIEEDPQAKEVNDAIKFMNGIVSGDIELMERDTDEEK